MTDAREISRDLVRHKVAAAMRARIGQGCKFSVAQVAAQTGIGASTIKGYLGGLAEPTLSQFIKLAACLGPVFASEITGIIDFDVMTHAPLDVSTMDVLSAASALMASGTTAMRTQSRVTHTVDLEVRPFVEEVVTAGQCWLAARERVATSRGHAANSNAPDTIWARLREWHDLRSWLARA